jgi:hypothetical protein
MSFFITILDRTLQGLLALRRAFRKNVRWFLKLSQAILPHRDLVQIKDLMQSVMLFFQLVGSFLVPIVFMLNVFGAGGLTKFSPHSNPPRTRGDYVCYLSSPEDGDRLEASSIERMPTNAPVLKP